MNEYEQENYKLRAEKSILENEIIKLRKQNKKQKDILNILKPCCKLDDKKNYLIIKIYLGEESAKKFNEWLGKEKEK